MANFTQTSPIQYKNYVATQPVELMTNIGMQREQQLQQGIEKVNSYVSSISGLDVLREVDKNHVQNKLAELKQGITDNLSGDFSDQRIVGQIAGAASQIYKDPQIRNAVDSTLLVRKGQQELEGYRKDGKGSVAQEYVYNDAVNRYAQDTDPHASFNTRAKQYSDYKKRAVEGLKALTKDETITDDAFTTNDKGQLVLADTTIRKKYAGISPEKVQSMLMNYLTPDDFDQIGAEGRYNYSNKAPEQFAQDLQSSYRDNYSVVENHIKELEASKTKTQDAATLASLDQQISSETNRLKGIENEYKNITISGDIESAKAQKSTFDFIHGFANTFAHQERSTTYTGKTPQENMQWRQEFTQKANQFADNLNWDKEKFGLNYAQNEKQFNQLHPKPIVGSGLGGWNVARSQDELANLAPTEKVVEETVAQANQFLNQQKSDFLSQATQKNLIPEGFKSSADKQAWYESQKTAWALNPANVDTSVAQHFNSIYQDERKAGQIQSTLQDIRKEADSKFNIKKLIPNLPTIGLTEGNNTWTFTPTEFVEAIPKFSKYVTVTNTPSGISGGTSTRTNVDYELAKKELSPKEYFLFEKNQKGDKTVQSYVQNYNNAVILPNNKLITDRNDFIKNQLQTKFLANQAGMYSIPTDDEVAKRGAADLLSGFATYSKGFNGSLPGADNFDEAKARALADDPKTHYQIQVNTGSTYDPAAYKIIASNSKETVEIPMSMEQKRNLMGTAYENVNALTFDKEYGEAMQMGGGFTTSVNKKNYIVTKDFGNLQSFGTVGNVIKVGDNYQFDLMVRNPITNAIIPIKLPRTPVAKDELINKRNTLTDDVIFEAIYGHAPSTEEKKVLMQAAKTNITN
jgi:hypothetical protein